MPNPTPTPAPALTEAVELALENLTPERVRALRGVHEASIAHCAGESCQALVAIEALADLVPEIPAISAALAQGEKAEGYRAALERIAALPPWSIEPRGCLYTAVGIAEEALKSTPALDAAHAGGTHG